MPGYEMGPDASLEVHINPLVNWVWMEFWCSPNGDRLA
jgi:hypothetical protein